MGGEIWEFVNPSTGKESLPTLVEPPLPRPEDVNPAHTTLTQLTDEEKEEYQLLRFNYKRKITIYDRQKAALASLRTYIQETISSTLLIYTFDCTIPYNMLKTLRQCVAPTDRARQLEASLKYQHLRQGLSNQSLNSWLLQWEKAYTECQKLDLPDVQKDRAVYDFLQAISTIAPEFSSVWMVNLQTQADSGKEIPDLHKIVELFRNHQRLTRAQKGHASHSAFAASF